MTNPYPLTKAELVAEAMALGMSSAEALPLGRTELQRRIASLKEGAESKASARVEQLERRNRRLREQINSNTSQKRAVVAAAVSDEVPTPVSDRWAEITDPQEAFLFGKDHAAELDAELEAVREHKRQATRASAAANLNQQLSK